jgi:hypothetical protein
VSEREKALESALGNCLEFMITEMHWEGFRAEFLIFDDKPKERASLENMRLLQNFLARPDIKPFVMELLP